MIYQLDEKDFDWFTHYAGELINRLGLTDWIIDFEFFELSDGREAQCKVSRAARRAALSLSSVWYDEEPTEEKIKQAAWHEVLELLLDDYDAIALMPSLSGEDRAFEVERTRHAIIHRLGRVL